MSSGSNKVRPMVENPTEGELINSQNNSMPQPNQINLVKETSDKNSNMEEKKEEGEMAVKPKKCDWKAWGPRIAIIAVILGIILYVALNLSDVQDFLGDFIEWIEDNPEGGIFILIAAYIVCTVTFIPGSILTVGAGFVFVKVFSTGLAILFGTIAVWAGAMVGSILAMLLGRYVFRDALKEKSKKWKYFSAIDRAVESDGLKLVFFLRLTPVMPFNIFNYLMGLTAVKTRDYTLGGFGMLPGTVMFVYIGTTLSNISDLVAGNYSGGTAYLILLIVGSVLGFGVLIYIGYLTKKELRKYIDIEDKDKKDAENKDEMNENNEENPAAVVDLENQNNNNVNQDEPQQQQQQPAM